jgi:hypothetical protein
LQKKHPEIIAPLRIPEKVFIDTNTSRKIIFIKKIDEIDSGVFNESIPLVPCWCGKICSNIIINSRHSAIVQCQAIEPTRIRVFP